MERHNAGGRQDVSWGWHRAHVSLITKGELSFRVRTYAGNRDFVGGAGSVCVFPSGYDETRFAIAVSKFEAIVVELDPARLEALLERPADAAQGNGVRGRSALPRRCPLRPGFVSGIGDLSRAKIFG